MAIANLKIMICDSDELLEVMTCTEEVQAETVTEARKLAREAGWTSVSEGGKSYDLCPTHSSEYEQRSRLAG